MEQKSTRDFLIRGMPIEVYYLLSQSAQDHHRSKNQEAILAITSGLARAKKQLKRPKPFKWKHTISNSFVLKAIDDGRE